nr:23 kDa jasmonate-induced protein-like [Ziziphus jujuba var. spinosa]
MALNVFGKPITNQTLKAMMEYQDKEVITAVDRAYEALMMKDADNKVEKARKFVEGLKPKYGAALISTLYLIYKATGNRLTFVGSHDREGHIGDSPYPLLLENDTMGCISSHPGVSI